MPFNTNALAALEALKENKTKLLGLEVGGHVVKPGDYIPRADAHEAPRLTFADANPDKKYIVVNLDFDGPFPSFAFLSPILHWIQPGFKAGPGGALEATEPSIVNYIGPGPPPGSAPHRYAFYIYEQPEEFNTAAYAPPDGTPVGRSQRMRYSLDTWETEAKLGSILAVNYFLSN